MLVVWLDGAVEPVSECVDVSGVLSLLKFGSDLVFGVLWGCGVDDVVDGDAHLVCFGELGFYRCDEIDEVEFGWHLSGFVGELS